MPILGLTDQGARFPQIGTLRKGAPKVSDRQPGKDLDHFRFDTEDADALAAFTAAYGETPRAINVYLPYPTVDENLSAWQEHWVAGGLKRRCDGQTCVLRQTKDGKYDTTPHPCVCTTLPADSRERCKPVGRLQVIIPELKRLAYVMALTTSMHDIKNLSQQLTALELSNGTLRGVPLVLRRTAAEISMPGQDGKRRRVEKWMLSIEAAPRWVGLQLQSMERQALTSGGYAALPAPAAPAPQRPQLAAPAYDDEGDDDAQVLPPAPLADASTGEVLELEQETAEQVPAMAGPVEGEPKAKYDNVGQLHLSFKVGGYNFLAKNADPALAFLEAGDEVELTYHAETIKGKSYNVVDSIVGQKDADGDAPWEARAAAAGDGASFTPVEEAAPLPAAA